MGAYVAARLAADHPDRVSSLVLVDGGLPIPVPSDAEPDELLTKTLGPAAKRLGQIFADRDDYVAMWRTHPAFAESWNADVEAYVKYDLEPAADGEEPGAVRSVVSADAFKIDGEELLLDDAARTALHRVRAPVWLLRAPRGLLDDEKQPLIPADLFDEFAAARPEAHLENVADTNHYTMRPRSAPHSDSSSPELRCLALAEALQVSRNAADRVARHLSPWPFFAHPSEHAFQRGLPQPRRALDLFRVITCSQGLVERFQV
jgi:pimeloyl-ACP methyl ester carboxylesterase